MTRVLFQNQQPWLRSLSWAAYCTAGLLSLRAAEDPAVFHVNTQLVEVDVVARGKHGPVANLTKDDFTILDNGKPQQIAVFSVRAASGGGQATGHPRRFCQVITASARSRLQSADPVGRGALQPDRDPVGRAQHGNVRPGVGSQ